MTEKSTQSQPNHARRPIDLSVSIENFKAIKSTTLHIHQGVNILIGSNGAGKTCILSALKFIRDVLFQGAGMAMAKGGGPVRVYRRRQKIIRFSIEYKFGNRLYRRSKVPFVLKWQIAVAQRGQDKLATIIKEDVSILASYKGSYKRVLGAYIDREEPGSLKGHLYVANPRLIGTDAFALSLMYAGNISKVRLIRDVSLSIRQELPEIKKQADGAILGRLGALDNEISILLSMFFNLNEYSIIPDIARQSTEQLALAEMLPNGSGLSEVIYALEKRRFSRIGNSRQFDDEQNYFGVILANNWRRSRDGNIRRLIGVPIFNPEPMPKSSRQTLRNALTNINAELAQAVSQIDRVSARIDETNGRHFVYFESGKDNFYPQEVSDGTIKWLCILVAIYVPFSAMFLLEEPENFLHPWMQQRLISIMREQSEANGTVFLLTTHSSTILNAATSDEVIVVKSSKKGTVAISASDKRDIELALENSNFRLGDLWVSGAIGGTPGEQ